MVFIDKLISFTCNTTIFNMLHPILVLLRYTDESTECNNIHSK